jgi:hypothetical protein
VVDDGFVGLVGFVVGGVVGAVAVGMITAPIFVTVARDGGGEGDGGRGVGVGVAVVDGVGVFLVGGVGCVLRALGWDRMREVLDGKTVLRKDGVG